MKKEDAHCLDTQLINAERQAVAEVHAFNRELENKVTERTIASEERNAELAHANQELQHLDEMKSEFVSLVSHELRALLTTPMADWNLPC